MSSKLFYACLCNESGAIDHVITSADVLVAADRVRCNFPNRGYVVDAQLRAVWHILGTSRPTLVPGVHAQGIVDHATKYGAELLA